MLKNVRPGWLRWLIYALILVGFIAIGFFGFAIADHAPWFAAWEQQYRVTVEAILWAIGFILLAYAIFNTVQRRRANAFHREGLELSRQQHYRRALEFYDRALAIQPTFTGSWINKGIIFMRLKRYDEAMVAIDKALSIKPEDSVAWLNKGVLFARLKRYDEASAATNKALVFDPKYALAWSNKADVLCEHLKRYDEAIAVCDAALARGIAIPGIWAFKGNALHALGRDEEARAAYERVLTFPADDAPSWDAHGDALAGFGCYDEALAAYAQVSTEGTDYPRVCRKKAGVLRALGRETEAQEAERQADDLEQPRAAG